MVNRLAGLVFLGACGWGAVVLFLCAVQLAGETVAWVANGGLGRLPGWSWPLIAAVVLGLVWVAWERWVWPGEVGEEVERRGEEPGAAVGGIGRPVCPKGKPFQCEVKYGSNAADAPSGCGGVVGTPPGVGWGTGPHGVQGGGQVVILPPGYKIVPATAAEGCGPACPFCALDSNAAAAPVCGPAAMAEFLDATTKEREGRGGS